MSRSGLIVKRLLCVSLAITLIFGGLLHPGMKRVSAASIQSIVDGGFESGNLGAWSTSSTKFQIVSDFKHAGGYALKIASTAQDWDSMTQNVAVQPGADYKLTYYGKGANAYLKVLAEDWSSALYEGNTNNGEDWTRNEITFNSGGQSNIVLYLSDSGADAYFDDFVLERLPGSVVANGGFENGDTSGWSTESAKFTVTADEKHDGTYALKVTSGLQEWQSFAQTVDVKPDTTYKFSFYGKGTGNVVYKLINVKNGAYANAILDKTTTNQAGSWTAYEATVTTGSDVSQLAIYLSDSGADAYFDEFKLTEQPSSPLMLNGGFESGDTVGWSTSPGKFGVSDEIAYDGVYAMKITSTTQAWDSMTQNVDVQPDTDYVLTFYMKGANSAYYKVLKKDWSASIKEGNTQTSASDWTLNEIKFNSGSNNQVVVYLSDTASDAYVDSFAISKVSREVGAMQNGGFESGDLTAWNAGDSSAFSVTDAVYRTGGYALDIAGGSTEDNLIQRIPVRNGTNYKLTFYGKTTAGGLEASVLSEDEARTLAHISVSDISNEWVAYSLSFNTNSSQQIVLKLSGSATGGYLDDFDLAKDTIVPDNGRQAASTEGFNLKDVGLVDPDATAATRSLFAYLDNIREDYTLFGHQNDTYEMVVPNVTSDTYNSVGAYPAVFGWEAENLRTDMDTIVQKVKDAYRMNGISTLSDHMPNFTSGGGFGDMTPTAQRILPGGEDNAKFTAWLDQLAAFAKLAVDDNGQPIPIIFRPFHENSGMWFWWGTTNTTKDEFIHLWRYTVEYLRDTKGVHNFLYAYSPNGHFADESDYLSRYPGDDYVDIMGFDMYNDSPKYDSGWMEAILKDAQYVVGAAAEHAKVPALTETGLRWDGSNGLALEGNTMPDWYMVLHDTLMSDPTAKKLAYMMVWRNQHDETPSHFWVPYRNHPTLGNHEMLDEFVRFYNQNDILFADRVTGNYSQAVSTLAKSPYAYIMAPGDKEKIKGEYTLKTKVFDYGKGVQKVNFTIGDGDAIVASLGVDGYYSAAWDSTTVADGKFAIRTMVTLGDGTVLEDAKMNVVVSNSDEGGTGDAALVDDFESYAGDNAELRSTFVKNSNGDMNTISLVPTPVPDKTGYAMKFVYNLGSSGYTGVAKTLNADWSKATALGLWIVGDGKGQDIILQLSSGGNSTEAHLNQFTGFDPNSTEPQYLEVPFSQFGVKSGSPLDLSTIRSFALYINAVANAKITDSTIIIDEIRAVIPNIAPVLEPIGAKSIAEGQTLTIVAHATDANGDALVYTASGLPSGATFDAVTHRLVWTPGYDQAGSYTVRFMVSDGKETAFEDVTITVTDTSVVNPGPITGGGDVPSTTTDNVQVVINGEQARVTLTNEATKAIIPVADLKGLPLLVHAGAVNLTVQSSLIKRLITLAGGDEGVKLEVRLQPITVDANTLPSSANDTLKLAGNVYELELMLLSKDGKSYSINQIDGDIQLSLSYGDAQVKPQLLGIYYLNETVGKWEYIGGKPDTTSKTVTTDLTHLSKYAVLEYSKNFEDVPSTHWAFDAVQTLTAKHVLYGVSESAFAPGAAITRAEFVAMLVRALGLGAADYAGGFNDVRSTDWYASSVQAAVDAGLVQGVSEIRFAPSERLTRAQMAVMLIRAMKLETARGELLSSYVDREEVPAWAEIKFAAAVSAGLIEGQGGQRLAPNATATRAEAATIILRMLAKQQ
ncbi:glycosyl hydrolase [Cohnella sp. 56]|uniref:glycosyl hydrolase n=1 Tax=Cohnella sp. 56 TaxID=3113722 RepID=UPI0030E8B8E5